MDIINKFVNSINSTFDLMSSKIDPFIFNGLLLFFFALMIVLLVALIRKFYMAISKKNFIILNLRKYNVSEHPLENKIFAVLFYFIEYLLIMPALILVWFTILSIVLLFIASDRAISQVLFLSCALIMAARILAYFKEDLSGELAKLFPFITLSVFLLTPGAVDTINFLEKLKELPSLLNNILSFILFIFILEFMLRIGYTLFELAKGKEELKEED